MPSDNSFPVSGIWTSTNPLNPGDSPKGSFAVADNVRFTAPSVVEPRPGFPTASANVGEDAADEITAIGFHNDLVFTHYLPAGDADEGKVSWAATSDLQTWETLDGDFIAENVRFVGANRDLFFNTDSGVQMVSADPEDTYESEFVAAGNPAPLAANGVSTSENGDWLPGNSAVAYRFTICSLDAFDRIIEGPPSGRSIVRNNTTVAIGDMSVASLVATADTSPSFHYLNVGDVVTVRAGSSDPNFPDGTSYTVTAVPTLSTFRFVTVLADGETNSKSLSFDNDRGGSVYLYLPEGLTTQHFLRLYRSDNTLTGDATPSDELFLVVETPYLVTDDLTSGRVLVADSMPMGFFGHGTPLYTNKSTGNADDGSPGALQANFQPPACEDMCFFANRMWFANTTAKQSINLQLLGVGAPSGLQAFDTITINGSTYTAYVSFGLETDSAPGENIRRTVVSLIQDINTSVTNTEVYAEYTSGDDDPPGKFRVYRRTFSDTPFTVTSDRGSAWTPNLPGVGDDWEVASNPNRHAARVYYSKLEKPDAAPILNFLQIGSDNEEILRIFPLNSRLYVFKPDGIWSVSDLAPFSVQKISSVRLLAPNSVSVLNETLYALTNQGIIRVRDGSVEPFSIAIDDDINDRFGEALPDLRTHAFGIGYESARQYLCWLPSSDVDAENFPVPDSAYVYSTLSRGFTKYIVGARTAAIEPTEDRLWLAAADGPYLLRENKSYTREDFYDATYSLTFVSISTDEDEGTSLLAVDTGMDDVEVGDTVVLDAAEYLIIDADEDDAEITILGTPEVTLTDDPYTCYRAIATEVVFNCVTAGNPASLKTWGQASLLFKQNEAYKTSVTFSSEVKQAEDVVELVNAVWGTFAWGEQPWGSPAQKLRRVEPLPTGQAQNCQLNVGFRIRHARVAYQFLGAIVEAAFDSKANRG
jgi:hypothetical protein